MKFRKERLDSLIRDLLSQIIQKEMEFSEGVLVTIVEVDTASDLSEAKVGVSVFPSDQKEVILKALNKRAGYFHSLIFKKLNIYAVPKLNFEYDNGSENAARIEEIALKEGK